MAWYKVVVVGNKGGVEGSYIGRRRTANDGTTAATTQAQA